jgi:ribosomal-protein-alanine N-acetyltransferase
MVARPRLRVRLDPMRSSDLEAVQRIEKASFSTPWPEYAYRQELETNRMAHYIVARVAGEVVGFAGIWLMVDEAHVTTFAVDPQWRRQGIGSHMILALLRMSRTLGARRGTLEVRLTNLAARKLYERFGFRPVGVRPRYYTDNGEDALIMTTDDLDQPEMVERIARLGRELERGLDRA